MGSPQGFGPSPPPYGPPPGYGQPQGYPPGGFRPIAQPPKNSGTSCLTIFLIVVGICVVGAIGVGIYVWIQFGALFGGVKEIAGIMMEAQSAPGTKEMRDLGCEQAFAVDAKKLADAINKMEKEMAKRENRSPKVSDFDKEGAFLVSCSVKTGTPPTCDQVAKAYIDATKPTDNIMVSVNHQSDSSKGCSMRYSPDGKSIGAAQKVDIPK